MKEQEESGAARQVPDWSGNGSGHPRKRSVRRVSGHNRVILKMNEDGSVVMFTGVSDMGNGSVTTSPGSGPGAGNQHGPDRVYTGRYRCHHV